MLQPAGVEQQQQLPPSSSVLQCVAMRWSVMQCVATCWGRAATAAVAIGAAGVAARVAAGAAAEAATGRAATGAGAPCPADTASQKSALATMRLFCFLCIHY